MSDSLESLRRQLGAAGELKSVVRAMKALAASSLAQYEKSALSLGEYQHTIDLGLRACHGRSLLPSATKSGVSASRSIGVVIFGSDQGLVGQFNENLAEYLQGCITPDLKPKIWAIGERIAAAAQERGFVDLERFELPHSIEGIAPIVGRLLVSIERFREKTAAPEIQVFHHCPKPGASYKPASQRLLPLDKEWSRIIVATPWPTKQIPEVIGAKAASFDALVREHIFISLFRACSESLAAENASRLAGMQRAEKNIAELSSDLTRRFHRLRQSSIDEELFDVVAGFEALGRRARKTS